MDSSSGVRVIDVKEAPVAHPGIGSSGGKRVTANVPFSEISVNTDRSRSPVVQAKSRNRCLVLVVSDQEATRSSLNPGYGPEPSATRNNRLDKNLVATNIVSTRKGESGVASRGLRDEIKKRNAFDSAEQEAALNIARTNDRLQSSFTQFFKQHGITGAQFNVLRILRGAGEPLPCQEIAGRMITQLPDITRLVDRLEEAGLVERSRTPEDRRLVLTTITEDGLRLLAAIDEPLLRLHREQLGHLTRSELAELNRLLVKARNPA